jgi:hypothetical protein
MKINEEKAENTPAGGVLIGERDGQTIIHDKGTMSGYLVGKLHKDGGIKAINKATGQPLEMQGGEIVITAPAVADTTKHNFNGKMMTNREILSKINSDGGGVSFADGGDIPAKIHTTEKEYEYGGKMVQDVEIARRLGWNSTLKKGGQLFSFFDKVYDIEKAYKMINSGQTIFDIKEVDTFPVKYSSMSKEYSKNLTPDFSVAQGLMIKFDNGQDLLIDGNHRMNNAYENGIKKIKVYYISNPKTIAKFSKKNKFELGGENKKASIIAKKDISSHYNELNDPFDDRKDSENWRKYALPYDTRFDIEFKDGGSLEEAIKEFDSDKYSVVYFIEKTGNILMPKNKGYFWVYDIPDAGKKIESGDFDFLLFPFARKYAQFDKGFVPPIKQVWTKKYQKTHKGAEHLIGIVECFFSESENKLYIQMMTVRPDFRRKGLNAYMINSLRTNFNLSKEDVVFVDTTEDGKKFEESGKFKEGGHLSKNKSLKQIAEMHNVSLSHINEQLAKGLEVEKEHFSDFKERTRVAKDHLVENPNYYSILEKAGLKMGGHLKSHHLQKEDLAKDAKSGNTPARDLNNYNDVMDLEADGAVGGDSGLAFADGGLTPYDASQEGDIFPVLSTGGGVEPIKVEKIIISQDLRRDKGYSRFVKKEFADFQSFKNALKELVEEEDKKIPNAVNNGGFLIRINEDSGDSPYFWFEFNNKQKNTVSKFNPSTGKVSDFEKQLKKKRPKVFNSLNWTDFFEGATASKQTAKDNSVTAISINYDNATTGKSGGMALASSTSKLYSDLIGLYQDRSQNVTIQPIGNKLGVNPIEINIYSEDWQTILFKQPLEVALTSINRILYGLFPNLNFDKFVRATTAISQTSASTSVKPFDFTDTKIDVVGNSQLSQKVQKRAFELGWEWENGGGKTIDYNDFNYLYFTKTSISSGYTNSSFVNSPKREITEEEIFGSQTPTSALTQSKNPLFYEFTGAGGTSFTKGKIYKIIDPTNLAGGENFIDNNGRSNGFGSSNKDFFMPSTEEAFLAQQSGKFTDGEIGLFKKIDKLIIDNSFVEVTLPIILWSKGADTKLFDLINDGTGEVFSFRSYDVNLGGVSEDSGNRRTVEILEKYVDWKSSGSLSNLSNKEKVRFLALTSDSGGYKNVSNLLEIKETIERIFSADGGSDGSVTLFANGLNGSSFTINYGDNKNCITCYDTLTDGTQSIKDILLFYSEADKYDWSDFFEEHKIEPYDVYATTLIWKDNSGKEIIERTDIFYGASGATLISQLKNIETQSQGRDVEVIIRAFADDDKGNQFEKNDYFTIGDYGFKPSTKTNEEIKEVVEEWIDGVNFDKFFEDVIPLKGSQTPTSTPVVPKTVENTVYDLDLAISKLEKASSAVVSDYNKDIYDQSLKFLYDTKATYELALKFTPESAFMYERLDIMKKLADIEKNIKKIEDMKKGGAFYMLAKILEKLQRGENWRLMEQTQDVITNQLPQSEIDIIIRSQKFKNWFGDWEKALVNDEYDNVSKALTNGIPSVYHHGARRKKYTYREVSNGVLYLAENISYALWFSQNATAQSEEGNYLTECFVNIKNPIDLTAFHVKMIDLADLVRYIDAIYPMAKIYDFIPAQVALLIKANQPTNVMMWAWQLIRKYAKFVNHIKENTPYDGFLYYENNPSDEVLNPITGQMEENVTKAVAIFKSPQVKVVDAVLFDGGFDDWRFENGGKIKN